jgi:subtilisin family serine protease
VRVAVIDTKLAWHPWFAGAVQGDADEIWTNPRDIPKSEAAQHAGFVSGLILNQAPGAHIHLRSRLNDAARAESWDVARKIARLSDEGIDVLNLSLGCSTDDGKPPLVLEAALNALGPETLVVASAGNHGQAGENGATAAQYPGGLESVVAVGALDENNRRAGFSPDAPWIDALAPGVKVLSTYTDRHGPRFATWSGTSFSAAIVSGAIAAAMRRGESSTEAWRRLVRDSNRLGGIPMIAAPARRWPTKP